LPPTRALAGGATCTIDAPVVVGEGETRLVPIAFGVREDARPVGWQDASERVWVRAIDAEGRPTGAPIDAGVPASGDHAWPHRRDAGFWIEPLGDGFAVFTQRPGAGGFLLAGRALTAQGQPRGAVLEVEGYRFAAPEEYRWVSTPRGLYALRPRGRQDRVVMERYTAPDGNLAREEVRAEERGRALALAVGDRAVGLVESNGKVLLRDDAGAEHEIAAIPRRPNIAYLGLHDRDVVVTWRTEGRAGQSSMLRVGPDGTASAPEVVSPDGPRPAALPDRIDGVVVPYSPEDATSPTDGVYRFETRDAAGARVSAPLELPSSPEVVTRWSGTGFLVGFARSPAPRRFEAVTQRISCR
jgi:hypothetical protein